MGGIRVYGWCFIILGMCIAWTSSADVGYFWHVSDMHLDHTYETWAGSCGNKKPDELGKFGDFACDSPWTLINSSVWGMKEIHPDPDFIIWTGDDTPHIWNDTILDQDVVFEIIDNLTSILEEVFPSQLFFSALGNHDWSPKSQLPVGPHSLYNRISRRWTNWLSLPGTNASDTFKLGAYYAAPIPNTNIKMVVLNTNLYYESDRETSGMDDPAVQLKWLESQLDKAQQDKQKVIIIGHVPPGMFEKHRSKHWFYPEKNQAFLEMSKKYAGIIGSMHFAHHHTDSFRLVYDDKDNPVSSMLIAPAVTPWETTLPGVIGGAGNNPSVRLLQYDRQSGTILNVLQYYLNLTKANIEGESWELEYNALEYYNIKDFSTSSLHQLAEKMRSDKAVFDKYYQANGVLFDPAEKCENECMYIHNCAIKELDYKRYEDCMTKSVNGGIKLYFSAYLLFCVLYSIKLIFQ